MQFNKIIIGGVSGVIMLIISVLINHFFEIIFPLLKSEYANPHLFRPWSDPLISVYYVVPFLTGIILVWIWDSINEIIPGGKIVKGIRFGLGYWITTLPGMIMTYSSFPLSFIIVLSWTITILVQSIGVALLLTFSLKN